MSVASENTSSSKTWRMYYVILLSIFIAQLALGLKNGLAPFIAETFHVSVAEAVWLTLALGVISVGVAPVAGNLSDIFGRKYVATIGMVLATGGMIGVGAITYWPFAVFSYGLLGLGLATLLPAATAYAQSNIPAAERGRAMGFYSLAALPGTVFGPTLGGLIADNWGGWQYAMYVGAVGCLLSAIVVHFFMPKPTVRLKASFDVPGIIAVLFTVTCLMVWLNVGQTSGITSTSSLLLIAGVVVGIVATVLVERGKIHPVLDLEYIGSRYFLIPIMILLGSYVVVGSTGYIGSFMVYGVLYGNATMAGILLMALYLPIAILSPFGGALGDRFGAKNMSILGVAITAVGLFLFTRVSMTTTMVELCTYAAIQGLGCGFFFANLTRIALSGARPERVQSAAGTYAMFKDVDGPIGSSLYGTWFGLLSTAMLPAFLVQKVSNLNLPADVLSALGSQGTAALSDPSVYGVLTNAGVNVQTLGAYAYSASMVDACVTVYWAQAAVAVVALLLAIFLLPNPKTAPVAKAITTEAKG